MNWRWLAIAVTGLMAVSLWSADRRWRKNPGRQVACVDQIGGPTFLGILFNAEPLPNGCSPPVHIYGRYIGQDPDPNIRFQLMRQPETGYTITK